MSCILYYSNYCQHSTKLLQNITKMSVDKQIHFICIDNREQNQGKTFIIMKDGSKMIMPENVTKVPALMLLNDNYKVIYGESIISYINRLRPQEPSNQVSTQMHQNQNLSNNSSFNQEPSCFSFSNTGSFHTLYILNNLISEDFILLESDLLYDKSVITHLLKEDANDIIISSDFTNSGDEVYVIQEDKRLIKLTKLLDKSEIPESEFVGISKISLSLYQKMCKNYEGIDSSKIEYEELFNNCAEENKIFIKNIKQLPWCEIDNKTHYKRAIDVVSPKIIQNEKI